MRKVVALTLLLAMALPGVAAACGGFFPITSDVMQTGQSVIFAVDHREHKVSAYLSLSYSGAAEDFAWVVPVPNEPTLDVSEPEMFEDLDLLTKPTFFFPTHPRCLDITNTGLGSRAGAPEGAAPGAGVDVHQQGQIGPYDYAVIASTDATALTSWLRENGYRMLPEVEPLIKVYTDEHMLFVAMKLRSGKESGDIQPVKLTFQGDVAMLPLRFSAIAAEPETRIQVWVFDQSQVAPEGIDRIIIPDDAIVLKSSGQNTYEDVFKAAIQAVNGRGFVTEYAQPSSELQANVSNAELDRLFKEHAFLTRLSTSLSPEQMTFDPTFIPAPALAPLSNIHDLTNRVSAYDCSRNLRSVQQQLIRRDSLQGRWIENSSFLPCLILPFLLIAAAIILLRRKRT